MATAMKGNEMKNLLYVFTIVLFLTSCAPSQAQIEKAIAETQTAMPTETKQPTQASTATLEPTKTASPTKTPEPTPESDNPSGIVGVAKNNLGSIERDGVIVELSRIIVADKNSVQDLFKDHEAFNDAKTAIELIFTITNNTEEKFNYYWDLEGMAAVMGEQVNFKDFYDFKLFTRESTVLPSVSVTVGLWMGVKNTEWQDVDQITFYLYRPNEFYYMPEFNFTIDVVDWGFEAMPDY